MSSSLLWVVVEDLQMEGQLTNLLTVDVDWVTYSHKSRLMTTQVYSHHWSITLHFSDLRLLDLSIARTLLKNITQIQNSLLY